MEKGLFRMTVNSNVRNRNDELKNNLDAYPVQSLDVGARDVYEINYSGTSMLVTKELYTELMNKALKYDAVKARNSELVQKYNALNESKRKVVEEFKTLDANAKELIAHATSWKEEVERLKKALELEQKTHFATATELSKFKQAPPQKKAYLTDAECASIKQYITECYQKGVQAKVTDIHEWIMREGRGRGDKRLANISYETVRATTKRIREELGII